MNWGLKSDSTAALPAEKAVLKGDGAPGSAGNWLFVNQSFKFLAVSHRTPPLLASPSVCAGTVAEEARV